MEEEMDDYFCWSELIDEKADKYECNACLHQYVGEEKLCPKCGEWQGLEMDR